MVADSAYFDVGVEYSNVTENDGFNQRVSFTDYTDEYKIENGKFRTSRWFEMIKSLVARIYLKLRRSRTA